MVDPERLIRRTRDRALDLAWDVLGPGPEAREFVFNFFNSFAANLVRLQNAYVAGELSREELYELIEKLVRQADAFLPVMAAAQIENFHRRFSNRLVASLADYDDEDPGPQVAR